MPKWKEYRPNQYTKKFKSNLTITFGFTKSKKLWIKLNKAFI